MGKSSAINLDGRGKRSSLEIDTGLGWYWLVVI